MASTPAFRAEHVGSLLRPQKLKDARVRLLGEDTPDTNIGPHGNADLATSRIPSSASFRTCRRGSGWRPPPTAKCAGAAGGWS
jgi:hypothetical protein